MPILLDVSGTMFASLHVDLRNGGEPHLHYIRHLVMKSIGHFNTKFKREYGEMYICCDSGSWRNKFFEYYKWVRRNIKDEDGIDWDLIYQIMEQILNELQMYFPFPVVRQRMAEGDDIIGVLTHKFTESGEKVMIVSGDKDMVYLTKNPLVKQYRPVQREEYIVDDPIRHEFELFVRGDKGDGIPSIKAPNDFYKEQALAKIRGDKKMIAPRITAKFMDEFWELYKVHRYNDEEIRKFLGEEMFTRFVRNRKLISLDMIPDILRDAILNLLPTLTRKNLMNDTLPFMQQNNMPLMAQKIKMFEPNAPTTLGKLFG